ncbi:MAG TPA: nitrile hydratase subunit beta [Bauldia sp.]|nr:nitrile hydratase subunit beta [Bauldia sp.]
MDGIHDLGGRQGYGQIDVNEPPEPFHAPWEARVLGIVRAFTRPATFSIDWFRHVRECIDPADYLTRPYYDQWLQTYAAMMVDAGAATVEELATGRSARPIPGVPPPMPPEKVATAKKAMARFDRESNARPLFAAGEAVRTLGMGARGHTRLPQYARGRPGRIETFRGFHVLPDTNMAGDGPAEPLYTVSFLAADLWPEAAGRRDRVYLDLWERYLERP